MIFPPPRISELGFAKGRTALIVVALTMLSACSTSSPARPSPSVPLAAAYANAPSGATAAAAPGDAWWDGFGDATLARLVQEALSANQDVSIALMRVGQARAGADAQASRL